MAHEACCILDVDRESYVRGVVLSRVVQLERGYVKGGAHGLTLFCAEQCGVGGKTTERNTSVSCGISQQQALFLAFDWDNVSMAVWSSKMFPSEDDRM